MQRVGRDCITASITDKIGTYNTETDFAGHEMAEISVLIL